MARDASYFHHLILGAEEVRGPLELSLSFIRVASETGLFNGQARQHVIRRLCVYQIRVAAFQRTLATGPERFGELCVVRAVT